MLKLNSIFRYEVPLFRPPGEANSVILQVTLGCSWNGCSFCEMYQSKQFRVKDERQVLEEIMEMGKIFQGVRKVFLADGNAMVLSTGRLLKILAAIEKSFGPRIRVSSYALPRDVLAKTGTELIELRTAGLELIYVGIESGDDEVLEMVNKHETAASTVEGLLKAGEAGITSSVMIVNGLAGKKYSRQHAIHSAEVVNRIQPRFFSTLVLTLPYGLDHYRARFRGEYIPMQDHDLDQELAWLIEHTDLKRTIFRSDHMSNHIELKGVLGQDKEKLLNQVRGNG